MRVVPTVDLPAVPTLSAMLHLGLRTATGGIPLIRGRLGVPRPACGVIDFAMASLVQFHVPGHRCLFHHPVCLGRAGARRRDTSGLSCVLRQPSQKSKHHFNARAKHDKQRGKNGPIRRLNPEALPCGQRHLSHKHIPLVLLTTPGYDAA